MYGLFNTKEKKYLSFYNNGLVDELDSYCLLPTADLIFEQLEKQVNNDEFELCAETVSFIL